MKILKNKIIKLLGGFTRDEFYNRKEAPDVKNMKKILSNMSLEISKVINDEKPVPMDKVERAKMEFAKCSSEKSHIYTDPATLTAGGLILEEIRLQHLGQPILAQVQLNLQSPCSSFPDFREYATKRFIVLKSKDPFIDSEVAFNVIKDEYQKLEDIYKKEMSS